MLQAHLFNAPWRKASVQENLLSNDIGLATIDLNIKFYDHEIAKLAPQQVGSILPHSLLSIWEEPLLHAELLKTRYHPVLPADRKIAYSWAYLWRIRPKQNLSSLTFECFLAPHSSIIDTDSETGEGIFSKSFSFGEEFIHIGTEDEDFLFQRARTNHGLPERYVKEKQIQEESQDLVVACSLARLSHTLSEEIAALPREVGLQRGEDSVRVTRPPLSEGQILRAECASSQKECEKGGQGVAIHLPPLQSGEVAQLQFIVVGGRDRIANWFALDADPQDILLQAGCRN